MVLLLAYTDFCLWAFCMWPSSGDGGLEGLIARGTYIFGRIRPNKEASWLVLRSIHHNLERLLESCRNSPKNHAFQSFINCGTLYGMASCSKTDKLWKGTKASKTGAWNIPLILAKVVFGTRQTWTRSLF
ncbi:predicted protein [Sclerotinia sclerotiorum 1980 UF-70]|uniref:Uncharacterized protein n=1 Tax=Sclerotinia sclerotiorum (strain ATCC 18683 / 1980 / Ss-1) TaxID=665079 RepID=A7EPV5_SCLS1|nr:predicted protein [Sclerotinia sclerotiorum 1980 UF-70]EDO04871.1 predicted protein [Sclerotinia sclerotiorum 1980 UF-70]